VLVARTVKGQGVPLMAGRAASHYAVLTERLHARVVRDMGSGS
jgi:transketolase